MLSGRGLSYWTDGREDRIIYVTPGYQMVALDASALAARLREYPFAEELAARLKEIKALGVGQLLRSVEKAHLLETEKFAHLDPLSIVPILDYVVRMERGVAKAKTDIQSLSTRRFRRKR